jgi:hypothetical protein
MKNNPKKYFKKLVILLLFLPIIIFPIAVFAALSCTVSTAAACTGGTNVVILRMSGSSNAHAELPAQSGGAFAANVICCSGVATLGNSCAATNKATVLKLQAVSNSHVEQNNQANFSNLACISDSAVADVISVAYLQSSCAGYDTTVGSISAATNAHVGGSSSFTTKICASIGSVPSLTFSNDDAAIGFGSLSSSSATYANGAATGSITDVTANTLTISTNATNGYVLTYYGDTLKNGANSISAATIANSTAGTAGTSQFAVSGTMTGTGSMTSTYDHAHSPSPNWNYAATTTTTIASSNAAAATDSIAMHYLANIPTTQASGAYSTSMTFILTGTF